MSLTRKPFGLFYDYYDYYSYSHTCRNLTLCFCCFLQEQCSGRTALHLAVDLQNPTLVCRLLDLGADVNCLNYGGFAPYHLTYGRQNEEIRCQLYERTAQELRELPESESDDSDMEDLDLSEDEVSICSALNITLRSDGVKTL